MSGSEFPANCAGNSCQTLVCDAFQASVPKTVAGEPMGFPQWEGAQRFRVLHVLQKDRHCPEFVHGIGRHTFRALSSRRGTAFSGPYGRSSESSLVIL